MIVFYILILILLIAIIVGVTLLVKYLHQILQTIGEALAEDYTQAVQIQKNKKSSLPAIKQKTKGRSVVNSEELVDLSDLDWEEGYKAIEELSNG